MFVYFVQIHKVFTNMWSSFHAPVMTVVFKLHPEFCQHDTDKGTDQDFEKVMTDLAQVPGDPSLTVMKGQYEDFKISCKTGSNQFHSEMKDREPGSFHEHFMSDDIHVWIRTFLNPWSDLMWITPRVDLLPCSDSA